MRLSRSLQDAQRVVDRFVRELERAEVHSDARARTEVQVRANRVLRVHVDRPHEPARLVSADWEQRHVDRRKALPDRRELRRVAGITGEVDGDAVGSNHVAAPERTVAIPRGPGREVLCRDAGDLGTANSRALPPVEFQNVPPKGGSYRFHSVPPEGGSCRFQNVPPEGGSYRFQNVPPEGGSYRSLGGGRRPPLNSVVSAFRRKIRFPPNSVASAFRRNMHLRANT